MPKREEFTLARVRDRVLRGRILELLWRMNQSGQTQIDIRFIERTIGDAKPEEVNTQLRYVIEKGYARDSTTKLDPGDKRELLSISITVQGIDVVDGTTADPGVVLGNL